MLSWNSKPNSSSIRPLRQDPGRRGQSPLGTGLDGKGSQWSGLPGDAPASGGQRSALLGRYLSSKKYVVVKTDRFEALPVLSSRRMSADVSLPSIGYAA